MLPFDCSRSTKQPWHKASPVGHFISMPALWSQKRRNGTHTHDAEICVFLFFSISALFPPVNLIMYLLTVYNHMDAVTLCCYREPDPPVIVGGDKAKFFALNYVT